MMQATRSAVFFAVLLYGTASGTQAQPQVQTQTQVQSQAQTGKPEDIGAQVYQQTCAACHATGVAKAPRYGDRAAWKPLIAEGQHVLTAHAWVGVRGMPARGGRSDLSLEDFSRATAYMARAAGGNWRDPDAAMLARIESEEQKRIKALAAKANKAGN